MAEEKEKTKKKKKTSQKWKLYEKKKGEKLERTRKTCPKCGAGVFMAKHKDRYTCGTCHYTEFVKEKSTS